MLGSHKVVALVAVVVAHIADEEALSSVAAQKIAANLLRRYADDVAAVPAAALVEALQTSQSPLEIAQSLNVDLPRLFRRIADGLPAVA